ncbi:MAG: NPCBM/NEW2 domain-containing protein, partial [Planctomycetaceae bacterium]|nr:NPCBM/NEW2 domain-containing protein [Planctomycetaceae bacterium]
SLGHGNVDLTITGDGQELFSGTVTARDKALPIDLDVSNKQFLQITVDFGKGLDIGDHLDLADAKLIK